MGRLTAENYAHLLIFSPVYMGASQEKVWIAKKSSQGDWRNGLGEMAGSVEEQMGKGQFVTVCLHVGLTSRFLSWDKSQHSWLAKLLMRGFLTPRSFWRQRAKFGECLCPSSAVFHMLTKEQGCWILWLEDIKLRKNPSNCKVVTPFCIPSSNDGELVLSAIWILAFLMGVSRHFMMF